MFVFGVWRLVLSVWVSGIWRVVSGVWRPASGSLSPLSFARARLAVYRHDKCMHSPLLSARAFYSSGRLPPLPLQVIVILVRRCVARALALVAYVIAHVRDCCSYAPRASGRHSPLSSRAWHPGPPSLLLQFFWRFRRNCFRAPAIRETHRNPGQQQFAASAFIFTTSLRVICSDVAAACFVKLFGA